MSKNTLYLNRFAAHMGGTETAISGLTGRVLCSLIVLILVTSLFALPRTSNSKDPFSGEGEDLELYFNTGDVIGCGYNDVKSEIFYTKNGKFMGMHDGSHFLAIPLTLSRMLGVGHQSVSIDSGPLYALISLAGPQEKIFANFGQAPFLWDGHYCVSVPCC